MEKFGSRRLASSATRSKANGAEDSLLHLRVFGQAEDIAVRIFEPGHLRAGGSCPDSEIVLRDVPIAFERDACPHEIGYRASNIGDLPAEDGAKRGGHLTTHPKPDHNAMGVEYKRVR